ncbi:hypothetical protein P0W64_03580 [Tsukamurella sp. 8F]|uniref:DUF7373 family lipoprotein n=1 Tax=unclassified Tsukamurella TaxID=2633480 RepID=UPI0023B899C9|nr:MULTISPECIES: hypothetical protein [unclassified Tsukamurella]MDF0529459.1 hypothetical protein [Tsukamurella sp. 8J]MDF0585853.1 hypothetical protein [Tsukamurella sp. 8F]
MRKILAVVSSCALLAGCATTVTGTPEADPSGLASMLRTGSFATEKRVIPASTEATGKMQEGRRMTELFPPLTTLDPTFQYHGHSGVGALESGEASVGSIFGSEVAPVFAGREVGAMVGANDSKPAPATSSKNVRGATVALLRMPSEQAATAAATDNRLMTPSSNKDNPAKIPTTVPGYGSSTAYTQDWGSSGKETVAFVAHKQYVIGFYTEATPNQIAGYLDPLTKAVDGFAPTPVDEFTTLPSDKDGIASLTLPPSNGDRDGWASAKAAIWDQDHLTTDLKAFTDAGVDIVGYGANQVYRARDATGAALLRDRFMAEARDSYAEVKAIAVPGVPDARCMNIKLYSNLDQHAIYCLLAVGRYMSEYSTNQQEEAIQATSAEYLIFKGAK